MAGRRSPPSDDLLLIAAATVLILTAQRYFQSPRLPKLGNTDFESRDCAGRP
jgi:hypothetical protein